MEFLLNLVWLLVALCGGAAFVIARRRSCVRVVPARSLTGLLAIGCATALLFPVISATDDLHPTQCLVEDAGKWGKKVVQSGIKSPTPPSSSSLIAALLMAWMLFTGGEPAFAVPAQRAMPLASRPCAALAQRGPPCAH